MLCIKFIFIICILCSSFVQSLQKWSKINIVGLHKLGQGLKLRMFINSMQRGQIWFVYKYSSWWEAGSIETKHFDKPNRMAK